MNVKYCPFWGRGEYSLPAERGEQQTRLPRPAHSCQNLLLSFRQLYIACVSAPTAAYWFGPKVYF